MHCGGNVSIIKMTIKRMNDSTDNSRPGLELNKTPAAGKREEQPLFR